MRHASSSRWNPGCRRRGAAGEVALRPEAVRPLDFLGMCELLGRGSAARSRHARVGGVPAFASARQAHQGRNKNEYLLHRRRPPEAVSFRPPEDEGRPAENLVFIELKNHGHEVDYWKKQDKFDYVVRYCGPFALGNRHLEYGCPLRLGGESADRVGRPPRLPGAGGTPSPERGGEDGGGGRSASFLSGSGCLGQPERLRPTGCLLQASREIRRYLLPVPRAPRAPAASRAPAA